MSTPVINAINQLNQSSLESLFASIASNQQARDNLSRSNRNIDKVSANTSLIRELDANEDAILRILCRREGRDPANFADLSAVAGDVSLVQALSVRQISTRLIRDASKAHNAISASDRATREMMCTPAGLDATTFANVSDLASDATAMSTIAADAQASRAMASVPLAMQEVASSQTARDEVFASQTAMQEVAASQLAMQELIASQTAMQEVAASQTAMQQVANSQTAINQLLIDESAVETIVADTVLSDTSAVSELSNSAVAERVQRNTGNSSNNRGAGSVTNERSLLVDIQQEGSGFDTNDNSNLLNFGSDAVGNVIIKDDHPAQIANSVTTNNARDQRVEILILKSS